MKSDRSQGKRQMAREMETTRNRDGAREEDGGTRRQPEIGRDRRDGGWSERQGDGEKERR